MQCSNVDNVLNALPAAGTMHIRASWPCHVLLAVSSNMLSMQIAFNRSVDPHAELRARMNLSCRVATCLRGSTASSRRATSSAGPAAAPSATSRYAP